MCNAHCELSSAHCLVRTGSVQCEIGCVVCSGSVLCAVCSGSVSCAVCSGSVSCVVFSMQCAVCVNHMFILSYARGVQRVIGNLSNMARCKYFIICLTASGMDICNDGLVEN